MGFLKDIFTGLRRVFSGGRLENEGEIKNYGNYGEIITRFYLEQQLISAKIKTNILINGGNRDIDILLVYSNKIFIIEVKNWKGNIQLNEDGSICKAKYDDCEGCWDYITLPNPFKQLKSEIFAIKKETNSNPYINGIVYFNEIDNVDINTSDIWFKDLNELVEYIKNCGKSSNLDQINKCFKNAKELDHIYANSKAKHCTILDDSLSFNINDRHISKKDIRSITIKHNLANDDFIIRLKDNTVLYKTYDNFPMAIKEDNKTYNICKIDYIIIGNND